MESNYQRNCNMRTLVIPSGSRAGDSPYQPSSAMSRFLGTTELVLMMGEYLDEDDAQRVQAVNRALYYCFIHQSRQHCFSTLSVDLGPGNLKSLEKYIQIAKYHGVAIYVKTLSLNLSYEHPISGLNSMLEQENPVEFETSLTQFHEKEDRYEIFHSIKDYLTAFKNCETIEIIHRVQSHERQRWIDSWIEADLPPELWDRLRSLEDVENETSIARFHEALRVLNASPQIRSLRIKTSPKPRRSRSPFDLFENSTSESVDLIKLNTHIKRLNVDIVFREVPDPCHNFPRALREIKLQSLFSGGYRGSGDAIDQLSSMLHFRSPSQLEEFILTFSECNPPYIYQALSGVSVGALICTNKAFSPKTSDEYGQIIPLVKMLLWLSEQNTDDLYGVLKLGHLHYLKADWSYSQKVSLLACAGFEPRPATKEERDVYMIEIVYEGQKLKNFLRRLAWDLYDNWRDTSGESFHLSISEDRFKGMLDGDFALPSD